MLVDTRIRGADIEFTAVFTDFDDAPIEPATVVVSVNFLNESGEREDVVIDMELDSEGWFAIWDSSVAKPARVYWSIKTTDPKIAGDGFFDLKGNLANLAEDSD